MKDTIFKSSTNLHVTQILLYFFSSPHYIIETPIFIGNIIGFLDMDKSVVIKREQMLKSLEYNNDWLGYNALNVINENRIDLNSSLTMYYGKRKYYREKFNELTCLYNYKLKKSDYKILCKVIDDYVYKIFSYNMDRKEACKYCYFFLNNYTCAFYKNKQKEEVRLQCLKYYPVANCKICSYKKGGFCQGLEKHGCNLFENKMENSRV
jgi:hypothetical protein